MKDNTITFNLNEILVDVIKLDGGLQNSIKRKVEENIIKEITDKFTDEYFQKNYYEDKENVDSAVVHQLAKDQIELIKKVVKGFADKVRFYGKDKTQKATDKFVESVESYINELGRI